MRKKVCVCVNPSFINILPFLTTVTLDKIVAKDSCHLLIATNEVQFKMYLTLVCEQKIHHDPYRIILVSKYEISLHQTACVV